MVNYYLDDPKKVISAHYPVNITGNDVYFKINDIAGSTVISRRKTGVVNHGGGTYTVDVDSLLTEAGVYTIIFDVEGTNYFASDVVQIVARDNIYQDFQEYNADKSVKKVVIKHSKNTDFSNPHLQKELTFEYNEDQDTVKTIQEKIL